jgi:hypothetical protein
VNGWTCVDCDADQLDDLSPAYPTGSHTLVSCPPAMLVLGHKETSRAAMNVRSRATPTPKLLAASFGRWLTHSSISPSSAAAAVRFGKQVLITKRLRGEAYGEQRSKKVVQGVVSVLFNSHRSRSEPRCRRPLMAQRKESRFDARSHQEFQFDTDHAGSRTARAKSLSMCPIDRARHLLSTDRAAIACRSRYGSHPPEQAAHTPSSA